MKKRMLSLLTTLALCLTLLPITALAAEVTDVPYISYTWNEGSQTLTKHDGSAATATVIDSSTTTWDGNTTGVWYVVNKDVTIGQRVTVTGNVHLILADGYTLTVNGGIRVAENNSLTIYGQSEDEDIMGKLIAQNTDGYNAAIGSNGNDTTGETAGTVTIHGGTVTATGSGGGAGIGGNSGGDGGEITIYGGTVEATGGGHGAGIGGGASGGGGTIAIYGGQVTAEGYYGAGIGGGSYGDGGTIIITGGTVTATGSGGGAGIGGGLGSAGGQITIYGGTVEATSTNLGAGIGGGGSGSIGESGGDGGTIIITGGTVAASSSSGAGIGVGDGDSGVGGTVIITGGTVTASSSSGAGIGSGEYGRDAGTFSTGTDGNAVIFASGSKAAIEDMSGQANSWQGVFFLGDSGLVYDPNGNGVTPVEDFSIPSGKTLTIEANKTLIIQNGITLSVEEGGMLTNSGTFVLYDKDRLTGAVDLAGSGGYYIASPFPVLSQTSLTYNGSDQFSSLRLAAASDTPPDPETILGQSFSYGNTGIWTIEPKEIKDVGDYEVQAVCGPFTASYTVTVKEKPAPPPPTYYTITADPDPAEGGTVSGGGRYVSGSPVTLTATANAGYRFVAWLENGQTVSTEAEYQFPANSSRKLTAAFEPILVTGVSLDKTTLNLPVGETGTLTATVQPSDALNQAVTWSSSNGNVATVEADSGDSTTATVTAVAAGTATITVTTQAGQKTATCTVTVPRPQQPSPPVDDGGGDDYVTPFGPSSGSYQGWDRIETALDKLPDGGTLTVTMNGETTLPGDVLDAIAGRDITLQLDLDGASWVIQGTSLPTGTSFADLDFGVETGTSGIPVDVVNAITGEKTTLQMTLAHSGDFGFELTLKLELDKTLAGRWANLYYFNEGIGALEFQYAARIGGTGIATFPFQHASQYAVVIDNQSHAPAEEQQPEPDALPFSDVAKGAWYYDAVEYVYENGLMTGTSEKTFSPGTDTSRAMVAAVLWRMAGSPVVNYAMNFSDVGQGQWYSEAIRWAASQKIVTGYDDGRFGTNDPITREQLAAMLYRYAQTMGYDVSVGEDTNILSYTDALTVSTYAVPAMQWACGAGILTGTGDGSTLSPQGQASRAETAAMLTRFCQAYVTQ